MFTQSDKKMQKIDDVDCVTFQPNTIMYAVDIKSDLVRRLQTQNMIVFHTTYT